jgi:hypothetical protein
MKFLASCFALLFALLFLTPSTARALTVSPIRLELFGDPGSTITGQFKLYNESKTAKTYRLGFRNFTAKDESGQPDFTDTETGIAKWANVPENTVTLAPEERREISFVVNIPYGIDPGGYFAAVTASTITQGQNGEGEVSLEGEAGTLILLQVNGNFEKGADILEFNTATKRRVFVNLPIDFYYRFQNEGQSFEKPLGDVVIENIFGGTTKIIPANPDGGSVLPRSIRRFAVSWLAPGGAGQLQDAKTQRAPEPLPGFWNHVKYEWKYFAIGRYTVRLGLTYGQEQTHTSKSLVIWVIPWHLLTLVGIGLFIEFTYRPIVRRIRAKLFGNKPS